MPGHICKQMQFFFLLFSMRRMYKCTYVLRFQVFSHWILNKLICHIIKYLPVSLSMSILSASVWKCIRNVLLMVALAAVIVSFKWEFSVRFDCVRFEEFSCVFVCIVHAIEHAETHHMTTRINMKDNSNNNKKVHPFKYPTIRLKRAERSCSTTGIRMIRISFVPFN